MTRTGILSDASIIAHCIEMRPLPLQAVIPMLYQPIKSRYRRQPKYLQVPPRPAAAYLITSNTAGLSDPDEFSKKYKRDLTNVLRAYSSSSSSTSSTGPRDEYELESYEIDPTEDDNPLGDTDSVTARYPGTPYSIADNVNLVSPAVGMAGPSSSRLSHSLIKTPSNMDVMRQTVANMGPASARALRIANPNYSTYTKVMLEKYDILGLTQEEGRDELTKYTYALIANEDPSEYAMQLPLGVSL